MRLDGRFDVGALVASGGMGSIHRGIDEETGRSVAIKLVQQLEPAAVERFRREAVLLRELAEPTIVSYVHHGATPGGAPYLVMEWLDGEDLASRLSRGPVPIADVLVLADRIASALAAIHALGIVHRDVKPANVFLCGGRCESAKLVDFGIARRAAVRALTGTGIAIGTAGYMAPEQVRGARDVDARADVFALGAVLHEAVSGRAAFAGDGPLAVLARVLLDDPPPLVSLSSAPPDLSALVAAMLAKDPSARPRDGGALLDALRRAGSGAVSGPAAVASKERRVVTVVAATPHDIALAPTAPHDATPSSTAGSARLERLYDGTLLYLFTGQEHSIDQAVGAARHALTLHRDPSIAGVSIASGRELVVGDSLPVGDILDRVCRLVRDAKDAVAIDPFTAELLDVRFEIARGEDGGHQLIGERRRTAPRRLLGRVSPCVGRDRDLAILSAAWAECSEEGRARAVLVTAPPGTGKTRLSAELIERTLVAPDPPEMVSATADPRMLSIPFALAAATLRSALGVRDDDRSSAAKAVVEAGLAREMNAHGELAAELLTTLAGFPSRSPSLRARALADDPGLLAQEIREAFASWLGARAKSRGLLLVLDDVQWSDRASLEAVEYALRRLVRERLMVLALARPEVDASLFAGGGAHVLRLGPLGVRASEHLARTMIPDAASEMVARVVALADGNAFYLEELLREVAEGRGASLPRTVVAMAAARLASLGDAERRLIRAASVLGAATREDSLAALLPDLSASIGPLTQRLTEREIFAEGPPGVGFRHALLREAAYASLTPEDACALHGAAAAWLADRPDVAPRVIADHLERAGEPKRAAYWYRRAAVDAYRFDDRDLLMSAAQSGIDCGADANDKSYLLSLMASAHWWWGDSRRAIERGVEALGVAETGTTAWYQAIAASFPALVQTPGEERWRSLVEQIVASHPTPETARRYFRAAAIIATEILHLGDFETATILVERLVAIVALGLRDESLADAARSLAPAGRSVDELLLIAGWDTRETALRAGHLIGRDLSGRSPSGALGLAEQLAAWHALVMGDPWRALVLARLSFRRLEAIGAARDPDWSRMVAACACVQLSRRAEIEELAPTTALFYAGSHAARAGIELVHDETERAARSADLALTGARSVGSGAMLAQALAMNARVSVRRGQHAPCLAWVEEACALSERYALHARLAWTARAEVALASGDALGARAAIDRAAASKGFGLFGEVGLLLDEHDIRCSIRDVSGAREALRRVAAKVDSVTESIGDAEARDSWIRSRLVERFRSTLAASP